MSAVVPPDRLLQVFQAQGRTALRWRESSAADRKKRIVRLREAVLDYRQGWYRAAEQDFRKQPGEVDLTELLPFCLEANQALRQLHRWMRPRPVRSTWMTLGTRAEVRYQPRGRCLIIGPSNYPINLVLSPLVSALAAGNTAILKPSELTPAMSGLLKQVLTDVFAPDEVAVFEGSSEVAQTLQDLPFDHVHFTGSTAVGKKVMASAARHLASLTLELGGKTPAIVDACADLKLAARNIVWAKFANAGQTCIAPDHIYVHASVMQRLGQLCRLEMEQAFGRSRADQESAGVLAHIVSQRHAQRLRDLIDDACQRGGRLLWGGHNGQAGTFVPPTLIEEPPADARLMQEEIFGPILPLLSFDDLDAVISRINLGPKPLALYVYSRSADRVGRIFAQTSSGGVCVNHALLQYLHGNLPFGGVNASGIGQSRGFFGFRAFSHERAVLQSRWPWLVRQLAPGAIPQWMRLVVHGGWRRW